MCSLLQPIEMIASTFLLKTIMMSDSYWSLGCSIVSNRTKMSPYSRSTRLFGQCTGPEVKYKKLIELCNLNWKCNQITIWVPTPRRGTHRSYVHAINLMSPNVGTNCRGYQEYPSKFSHLFRRFSIRQNACILFSFQTSRLSLDFKSIRISH